MSTITAQILINLSLGTLWRVFKDVFPGTGWGFQIFPKNGSGRLCQDDLQVVGCEVAPIICELTIENDCDGLAFRRRGIKFFTFVIVCGYPDF